MTKVALKGDALGTGTVTLSAPNTNDAIDFELPVTGTHLASAQADGMPLGPGGDPVVESGSNSDGMWTRWADGTQIAARDVDINGGANVPAGGIQQQNITQPVAFLGGVRATATLSGDSSPTVDAWTEISMAITTIGTYFCVRNNSSSSLGSGKLLVSWHGRWK